MTRAPVLFAVHFAVACLLAGCDRPQALSVDALAADPARLHRLLAQCRRGEHKAAFCARVDQADLQRFMSGRAGQGRTNTARSPSFLQTSRPVSTARVPARIPAIRRHPVLRQRRRGHERRFHH